MTDQQPQRNSQMEPRFTPTNPIPNNFNSFQQNPNLNNNFNNFNSNFNDANNNNNQNHFNNFNNNNFNTFNNNPNNQSNFNNFNINNHNDFPNTFNNANNNQSNFNNFNNGNNNFTNNFNNSNNQNQFNNNTFNNADNNQSNFNNFNNGNNYLPNNFNNNNTNNNQNNNNLPKPPIFKSVPHPQTPAQTFNSLNNPSNTINTSNLIFKSVPHPQTQPPQTRTSTTPPTTPSKPKTTSSFIPTPSNFVPKPNFNNQQQPKNTTTTTTTITTPPQPKNTLSKQKNITPTIPTFNAQTAPHRQDSFQNFTQFQNQPTNNQIQIPTLSSPERSPPISQSKTSTARKSKKKKFMELEKLTEEMIKCFQNDKFDATLRIANEILENHPCNLKALFCRGDCNRQTAKFTLALIDLSKANGLISKAYDREEDRINILSSLGATQIQLGELENGIKNLKASFQLDQQNELTVRELANAYLLNGEYEKSIILLNNLIKKKPKESWNFWKQGVVWRKSGKMTESILSFQTALELDPEANLIIADLADTYREMKMFDLALNLLSQLDDLESIAETEIVKAHIYIEMGNLTLAEFALKTAQSELLDASHIQKFQIVRSLLEEKKQLSQKHIIVMEKEPIKLFEQISKLFNSLKSDLSKTNFEKVSSSLIQCTNSFTSESGSDVTFQLSKTVCDLKTRNENLKRKNSELNALKMQHEIDLNCVICMEKSRDSVVMPCMHFLFCKGCIEQHLKTSKQCPLCSQSISGTLNCFLEGNVDDLTDLNELNKKDPKRQRHD